MKKVVEIFDSWQGEGLFQGSRAVFIRFGGCNLRCKWCDTKYSSFPENFQFENWLSLDEVFERVEQYYKKGIRRFIFTGGEPMLQQDSIAEIMDFIDSLFTTYDVENGRKAADIPVFEIETNGTIDITPTLKTRLNHYNNIFNISPKPPYSQVKGWESKVKPILLDKIDQYYTENLVNEYIVKFVVNDEKDKEFVEQVQQKYNIPPSKIYIQPNCMDGLDCINKMKSLLDWCKMKNYNISPRLQFILKTK